MRPEPLADLEIIDRHQFYLSGIPPRRTSSRLRGRSCDLMAGGGEPHRHARLANYPGISIAAGTAAGRPVRASPHVGAGFQVGRFGAPPAFEPMNARSASFGVRRGDTPR